VDCYYSLLCKHYWRWRARYVQLLDAIITNAMAKGYLFSDFREIRIGKLDMQHF